MREAFNIFLLTPNKKVSFLFMQNCITAGDWIMEGMHSSEVRDRYQ